MSEWAASSESDHGEGLPCDDSVRHTSDMATDPTATSAERDPHSGTSTALVEIEPGTAILYGSEVPEGLEVTPFALVGGRNVETVGSSIAQATGLANIAAQGVSGVMNVQGLVRLAPETLKALQTAQPLTSGGYNLGTLASNGKIVSQVRWMPAGSAATAGVVASLGPAIALMAIQAQLNTVIELSRDNLELTTAVLDEVRQQKWAEVRGQHKALHQATDEATHVGSVTDSIWREVEGRKPTLNEHWGHYESRVRSHIADLAKHSEARARQKHLSQHGISILSDVQALLTAQSSWFRYEGLRAASLVERAEANEEDAKLLERVIENAREAHSETLTDTDRLLDDVDREFGVMAELPGQFTVALGKKRRAVDDVHAMARSARDSLARLRGMAYTSKLPTVDRPDVAAVEDSDELEGVLGLWGFRLHHDETVLGIAECRAGSGILDVMDAGWVLVTDQRVLFAKQDDFKKYAAVERSLLCDQIRYVRLRERSGRQGRQIDIALRDEDLTLKFSRWATSDEWSAQVEEFADLLKAMMNIPEAERRALPNGVSQLERDSAAQ